MVVIPVVEREPVEKPMAEKMRVGIPEIVKQGVVKIPVSVGLPVTVKVEGLKSPGLTV